MGRKASLMPQGVSVHGRGIRVRYTDASGARHVKRLLVPGTLEPLAPTPANIAHAGKMVRRIQERIRLGVFEPGEFFADEAKPAVERTVADVLDTFMSSLTVEHSTREGYASATRFWKESVGSRPVAAVTLSELKKVIAEAHAPAKGDQRPMLAKTLNNYRSVLRQAFALAKSDGVLRENVAAELPRLKVQRLPPDPFTVAETERILAEFDRRFGGQVANFVRFWFWTGLRTSEIFALKWTSVDLASGYVEISEAMVRGRHKSKTKTGVRRRVKLNSVAMEALEKQKQHTFLADGEVFQDPRYDKPWIEERAFRRSYWTPVLKSLGIRYRRAYTMRHTYATRLLEAGLTPAYCAKQLGHSVQMFLVVYADWVDEAATDREMARLEAVIAPSPARRTATADESAVAH